MEGKRKGEEVRVRGLFTGMMKEKGGKRICGAGRGTSSLRSSSCHGSGHSDECSRPRCAKGELRRQHLSGLVQRARGGPPPAYTR